MIRKLLSVSLLGVVLGCGGSGDSESLVRVVHNSPDAPAVDVTVDGAKVIEGVRFPQFSEYLPVTPGRRNLKVLVAGTDTAVIDVTPQLIVDRRYSVLAINRVADIDALLLENRSAPNTSGGCDVRVVHGAPGAPSVDVYATAPDASLASAAPVLANVPYKGVSGYLSVPCGTYQFRVTVAGTKTVAIDSGATALQPNTVLTVIARDAVGGGAPFGLTVLRDNE